MDKDLDDLLDIRLKLLDRINALEKQINSMQAESASLRDQSQIVSKQLSPHATAFSFAGVSTGVTSSATRAPGSPERDTDKLIEKAKILSTCNVRDVVDPVQLQAMIMDMQACLEHLPEVSRSIQLTTMGATAKRDIADKEGEQEIVELHNALHELEAEYDGLLKSLGSLT